ncbi:MAG: hypothetical protein D6820_04220 [Lentisphaerae bacterium]|nr:MAG: hypothetical protein D6820_04220 [Lentisphaerota bacterium]
MAQDLLFIPFFRFSWAGVNFWLFHVRCVCVESILMLGYPKKNIMTYLAFHQRDMLLCGKFFVLG